MSCIHVSFLHVEMYSVMGMELSSKRAMGASMTWRLVFLSFSLQLSTEQHPMATRNDDQSWSNEEEWKTTRRKRRKGIKRWQQQQGINHPAGSVSVSVHLLVLVLFIPCEVASCRPSRVHAAWNTEYIQSTASLLSPAPSCSGLTCPSFLVLSFYISYIKSSEFINLSFTCVIPLPVPPCPHPFPLVLSVSMSPCLHVSCPAEWVLVACSL